MKRPRGLSHRHQGLASRLLKTVLPRAQHRSSEGLIRSSFSMALEELEPRQMLSVAPYDGPLESPLSSEELIAAAAEISFITRADGMPLLESDPSAPAAIFLDFDGDVGDPQIGPVDPYDTDGDPTTFNASEQADITNAWNDVAQIFSMFDVNVTTDSTILTND